MVDEVRVRDRGAVQHQCREGDGRYYRGLVCGQRGGLGDRHRGGYVRPVHHLIILPTRYVTII